MEQNNEVKELFDALYLSEKKLSPSQFLYVQSTKRQFARNRELSEKQVKILREIKKFLPATEVIRYTEQPK